jgi:polygalacturonase
VKSKSALKGAQGHFAPKPSSPRIFTSRNKTLTATVIALALSAAALPASATNWWTATPAVSVGPTVINVRNMGAMGNGVTDDTAAFQAAINALPASGGTIVVPNGTYMINALKSINLRSHTRLSMWGAAYLKAIPNNAQRYWVIKAWNANNVEIVGGHVVGERSQHQGTTGEWGYGINVSGSSNVYVHDIQIADFWGDGILVGAIGSGRSAVLSNGVTLNRVTSSNNRRQGLTIAPATDVYVVNSNFTGSNGTAPQSGIDIEPMTQGTTQHVRLENTTVSGNAGNGLEVHNYVSDLVLNRFTSENNRGYGVFANSPNTVTITNSSLTQNYLFGVAINGTTSNVKIIGNTIDYNGAAWFYAHNVSVFTPGWVPRDITIASTAVNVTQSNNTVSPHRY